MILTCVRACLVAAMLPASVALAQTEVPLGSRIPQKVETNSVQQDDAAKVRALFVACVYDKHPKQVDALIAASDTLHVDFKRAGLKQDRIVDALAMDSCLSKATSITDSGLVLKMNFPSLRAMLLEESYRAHNPAGPSWISAVRARPARSFVSTDEDLVGARSAASFADCVVAAGPREADALVRTPPGSAAEKTALKPLIPHLGPCIPQGMEVKFDPVQLRGLVADGLWAAWRGSTAAPVSSDGAK